MASIGIAGAGRSLARAVLLAGGLAAAGLGPAHAQWLGLPDEAPLPPGAIVRSLMDRGFAEIGRPRLQGEVYVVEGVNARGMRLRLVIDAYDGSLVSRTRLDAPLLPPADVDRGERLARREPYRGDPQEDFEDEEPARPGWDGLPVDRDVLRPRLDGHRAGRIDPPPMEPYRTAPPPAPRQAAKAEPEPRQPALAPATKPARKAGEARAVPAAPAEAATLDAPKEPPAATAAIPAPVASVPAPARPAEPPAKPPQEAGQRSVRVIGGVTPMAPQAREILDLPRPEAPPPVTLE